jgi:hypothetical protein
MIINFIPQARVDFTERELDLMIACSKIHYDLVCRSLSAAGGILYNFKSRLKLKMPLPFLSFRELDALAKCVEVYAHLGDTEDGADALWLGGKLRLALNAINECTVPDVEVEV